MKDKDYMKIVTIDGPASSGKGTVAKIIAAKLGFNYLDSGAIYRVVGLLAYRNNLDYNLDSDGVDNLNDADSVDDANNAEDADYVAVNIDSDNSTNNNTHNNHSAINKLLQLMDNTSIEFTTNNGGVTINGENVSDIIRSEKVGMLASKFSCVAIIRQKLLQFQRNFAHDPGLVTDGRDMGSVVFPDAALKVYLTASPEIRAQRRLLQLQRSGESVTITPVLRDILARDAQDSLRKAAPLKFDESFKVLDNSNITIDETVDIIISWLN